MADDSAQLQSQLQQKERELQEQLDRIYQMVEEGKAASFVQIEFKRAVERTTEKYQLLLALLALQQESLGTTEYQRRDTELRDQLKEDIVLLATAIDDAMGIGKE